MAGHGCAIQVVGIVLQGTIRVGCSTAQQGTRGTLVLSTNTASHKAKGLADSNTALDVFAELA